jgi:hypothetical protein
MWIMACTDLMDDVNAAVINVGGGAKLQQSTYPGQASKGRLTESFVTFESNKCVQGAFMFSSPD